MFGLVCLDEIAEVSNMEHAGAQWVQSVTKMELSEGEKMKLSDALLSQPPLSFRFVLIGDYVNPK